MVKTGSLYNNISKIFGITALSIAPLISGCNSLESRISEPTSITRNIESPTFDDMLRYFPKLTDEERKRVEIDWNEFEKEDQEMLYRMYSNPEKFYESELDESQKKIISENPNPVKKLSKYRREEYEEYFPWINLENPTLSDKMFIQLGEYGKERSRN